MKIVVPVKSVAVLDDEPEIVGGVAVDPDALDRDLNEWDAFSLEEALLLREAAGEGEVVVVTVGDADADEALLACLAKGADRGLRVWDDALEGADALAVAYVLAAAVEREAPDLVLCGVQSSDAVNGATGVALAGYLDLPRAAVVAGIEHDAASGAVTVRRELEGGLVELVRVGLPALLTVQTGGNEPRYANLRALKQAREKPREQRSLAELGLDAGAVAATTGSRVRALAVPERGAGAEMLGGSADDVARRIVEIVGERVS
ncbi:MAG TPA: electron transfer flavoprotein subunit beta/FixA family protein [Conexibacter sp.]